MRHSAPIWSRRAFVAGLLALVAGASVHASSNQIGHAASSGTIVGAQVITSTEIDVDDCAPGDAARTAFPALPVRTSMLLADTCSVGFRSSVNGSTLRIAQQDGAGDAMWRATDGAKQTSFGSDGVVMHDYSGSAGNDHITAMGVDAEGRVVTGGKCGVGVRVHMCLVRLLDDGSVDPTFNGGAPVLMDPSNTLSANSNWDSNLVTNFLVDAEGRLLATGTCNSPGGGHDFCMMRVLADGSMDTSFGSGGYVVYQPGGVPGFTAQYSFSSGVLADGSIVVGGICHVTSTARDPCVVWFDEHGQPDLTKGDAGATTIVTPAAGPAGRYESINSIVELDDGRVIGAASCFVDAGPRHYCLMAFGEDGRLDATFGDAATPGIAHDDLDAASMGRLSTMTRDGDGLLIGGSCASYVPCVARFQLDGTLDEDWGTAGGHTPLTSSTPLQYVKSIEVLPTGELDVFATCQRYDFDVGATIAGPCLMRLDGATGEQDPTFGAGGIAVNEIEGMQSYTSNLGFPFGGAVAREDGSYMFGTDCRVLGGPTAESCVLRIRSGETFPDAGDAGASWEADGEGIFGACLESVTGGVEEAWTATGGTCQRSDATLGTWNAIPTSETAIARNTSGGGAWATAHLRFGLRVSSDQLVGRYAAPIRFEVVAPG